MKVVAEKIGMGSKYIDNILQPYTVLKVCKSYVVDVVKNENNSTVVLGYDSYKNPEKKMSKSIIGIYKKKNITPCKKMQSFKTEKGDNYKIGDAINSSILSDFIKLGSFINVTGISKGKGFQGGMKRWNFKGLEASHGVSVSHRSIGSTGQREWPGKVFKGKKMPGQMGSKQITVKNLEIIDFDSDNEVICVRGSVPGHNNSNVVINLINIDK